MYHIAFDEIAWELASTGVRSKVHKTGTMQLRLLEFGPDLVHPHWCTTGHIGYVVEGEMEIEFDNETVLFRAGDGLNIPPGEKNRHRPKAISKVVRLIFLEEV